MPRKPRRLDANQIAFRKKREQCAAFIVERVEAAAREGKPTPTTREIAEAFGIGEKTCSKTFLKLRADGILKWRTAYIGAPLAQIRVITVVASGLTTSLPPRAPKAASKPRPSRAKRAEFKLKPRLEKIGISDRQLYGTLEESVKILRHRGYIVFRDKGGVRVGNALLSFEEMAAVAARESRLMRAGSQNGAGAP